MGQRLKRVTCRLLGCVAADNYPGCARCEAGIYDIEFVQIGRLDFAFRWYWAARRFVQRFTGRKCDVCYRRYWRGRDQWVCSDECFDKWLPF